MLRFLAAEQLEVQSDPSGFGPELPFVQRRTRRVTLWSFGDPAYFPGGVKHRYTRSAAG